MPSPHTSSPDFITKMLEGMIIAVLIAIVVVLIHGAIVGVC